MERMKIRITVSMEERLVSQLDELVQRNVYQSRSEALEAAARALQGRLRQESFERNLALLDPAEEQADAELGMQEWSDVVAEPAVNDEWKGAVERHLRGAVGQ